ncbi:MAG: hypothetical protein ACRDTP_02550 [Mycobacteriales bacterium]
MTAPAKFYQGGRLTGAALRGAAPMSAYKAQAQAVTSSTVLANDDALLLQLAAGGVYYFRCKLGYTGDVSGSGDIKLGWTLPSAATMGYALYGISGGSATNGYWEAQTSVPALNSNGTTPVACVMRGTVSVSSTPGVMQLTWCQHISSATATSVLPGSSLLAWQVA